VSSEQLATFYEKLPAEERDRLDLMPTVERDAELRNLYARSNFFRRGELGNWGGEKRGSRRGPRSSEPQRSTSETQRSPSSD